MSAKATDTELAVVIPSRGRPLQCGRLLAQIAATAKTGPTCVVAVDANDDTLPVYASVVAGHRPLRVELLAVEPGGHVAAINAAAAALLSRRRVPDIIVKLDDDHWPVTPGWDIRMMETLAMCGPGVVYGDDLLQGQRLPTAPGISSAIVEALGYMGLPALSHMFVDDFWRDLAQTAGCLTYLPDVVIEHRHPAVGKAAMDDGYTRVGTQELFDMDEAAWHAYLDSGQLQHDAAVVRRLVASRRAAA